MRAAGRRGPRGDVHVTVSIGVAELHDDESPDGLLRAADDALHAAKAARRDLVVARAPRAV